MKKRLKWLLLCLLGAAFLAAGAEGLYEGVPHSVEATFLALVGVIAVLVAVHRMITIWNPATCSGWQGTCLWRQVSA
jgi:hypothetical protein